MIKTTERGWAGHYCCSKNCLFRRNTLVEYNGFKLIVSTVGNQISRLDVGRFLKKGDHMMIGADRWYETMVFESKYDEYDDADVSHEVFIYSNCGIYGGSWEDACANYENDLDIEANMMHDNVVKEMCARISKLKELKDNGELFREG